MEYSRQNNFKLPNKSKRILPWDLTCTNNLAYKKIRHPNQRSVYIELIFCILESGYVLTVWEWYIPVVEKRKGRKAIRYIIKGPTSKYILYLG